MPARARASSRTIGIRPLLLAPLALLVACGTEPAEPVSQSRPVVVREGAGRFTLHAPSAPAAPVPVYVGPSPDAIDRSQPVATLTGRQVTIEGLPEAGRPFFELHTEAGPRIVSERLIRLDGASNFRDLGGYPTEDGRHVRWGQLFRSDALADLSDADVRRVGELGIRLVCDFRGPSERTDAPDRLPADDPPKVALLEIHDERVDVAAIEETIRSGQFEGVDFAQLLVDGNRAFVLEFSDRYAALFERLSDPANLPALVHCTGGKDRAGLASALILLALGVPEETVFSDFLLTNVYTAAKIERTLTILRVASLFRRDPEAVRPLLEVRREYLQAAFDAIHERWGSFDAYLRDGLGVDDGERRALQERLLR
jgi:protein-tyrosine phosphatase